MRHSFTYNHFSQIISIVKSKGYKFINYEDIDHNNRCIILRHDIDISLEKAYQLAKLEKRIKHYSYLFLNRAIKSGRI